MFERCRLTETRFASAKLSGCSDVTLPRVPSHGLRQVRSRGGKCHASFGETSPHANCIGHCTLTAGSPLGCRATARSWVAFPIEFGRSPRQIAPGCRVSPHAGLGRRLLRLDLVGALASSAGRGQVPPLIWRDQPSCQLHQPSQSDRLQCPRVSRERGIMAGTFPGMAPFSRPEAMA